MKREVLKKKLKESKIKAEIAERELKDYKEKIYNTIKLFSEVIEKNEGKDEFKDEWGRGWIEGNKSMIKIIIKML